MNKEKWDGPDADLKKEINKELMFLNGPLENQSYSLLDCSRDPEVWRSDNQKGVETVFEYKGEKYYLLLEYNYD